MRNKKIKIFLSILMAAATLLCGCGGVNTEEPEASESDTEQTSAPDVTDPAAGITGAPEFTVNRPDGKGKVVSTAGYISESNSGEENAAGMARLLEEISASNSSGEKVGRLEIPTGTYRFGGEKANTIVMKGLSELLIDGGGSTFIFEEHKTYSQGCFIRIESCNTLEIRDLTIDWDWEKYPLFVIGEVTEANVAKKTVKFRIDSHSLPEDMTFRLTFGLGRSWDPAIDNRSDSVGFIQKDTPTAVKRISDHEIEVTYAGDKSAKSAVAGQQFQFYFQPNHNAGGFHLQSNTHLTFEGVTIHSVPYEAVNALNSEYLQFLSCKVVPGEGRRFSTYGGLEIHAVKGYFRLEDSTLSGICDDNIHLSNHFFGGKNIKQSENTVLLTELQTWSSKDYIYDGANFELRNEQYEEKGWSSVITSWEMIIDKDAPTANKTTYLVTFRDPLPDNFRDTDRFFNTDYYTGGYVIRNNTFLGGMTHAMYIGLPNGTIENNVATNFAYPSLIVNTVQRWERWYIGTPIHNVIIRGNSFVDSNTAMRDPASVAVGAGVDKQPTDYYPARTRVVSDILIENNTVKNSTGAALAVFSAENVYIRNNMLLNSNTEPTTKSRRKGWGALWVTHSDGVHIEGNTVENSSDAYENGIYVDKTATAEIVE